MKRNSATISAWSLAVAAVSLVAPANAATSPETSGRDWFRALSEMPLPNAATLTRSNAIRLVLESFRSNDTVRAIVFLPGVPDDFFLIHRNQPIDARVTNVGETIAVLTNSTPVRATFSAGVVRLHTESDQLEPASVTIDPRLRSELDQKCGLAHPFWVDSHWREVQPMLVRSLHYSIRPGPDSQDAWHFERVNLAAHGLTNWELLQLVASATGTQLSTQRRTLLFTRPR